MTVDHFGFGVSDYERAKIFYAEALAPLGITLVMEFGPEQTEGKVWACGLGKGGKPELWIGSDGKTTPPMHVAFAADTRAEVRAFYEAALRAGGRTMARRACGRSTIRTTTAPSSSTSTVTTSRSSATGRSERNESKLNRAIAVAMADGADRGLALLDALQARGELVDYHLLSAARANLFRRAGRFAEAAASYRRAISLTGNEAERRFLERRLHEVTEVEVARRGGIPPQRNP